MQPVDEQRRMEPRPCEDCGSGVVSGLEPFAFGDEHPGQGPKYRYDRSDWCTNLECPSNNVRGLHRIGVNDYQCLDCEALLRTPFTDIAAHRRMHHGQADEPGVYSYS